MQNKQQNGLEIYAKVEDLLGVREVAPKLYSKYFEILQECSFDSLIDIGCGSGHFLQQLQNLYPNKEFYGIDKSQIMVERTQQLGLNASNKRVSEISSKYDIATATFDMVNYLTEEELISLFQELSLVINAGGYFIFDVNSEYGLSDLAVGSFSAEDSNRFVAIESYYEDGLYESHFTLFEQEGSLYRKSDGVIEQYFYAKTFFESISGWELEKSLPMKLYEMDKHDKELYIMKKR